MIGRITTAGAITNLYPANSAGALTTGPDGALWFVGANAIGRMTTAGVVTNTFPIPTVNSGVSAITSGPDGALWFTEGLASKIGRLTPSGAFTEYSTASFGLPPLCSANGSSLPCTNRTSSPSSLVAGPDGALWFIDIGPREIGRITTSGAITEYTIPGLSGGGGILAGVTVGPDSALWFSAFGSNIGRITTAGVVTNLFSIPTPAIGALGITVGADGALRYADTSVPSIGRVTTSGSFSYYPLPQPAYSPTSVALGSDGAVWFSAYQGPSTGSGASGGVIGRVDGSGSVVVPALSTWMFATLTLLLASLAVFAISRRYLSTQG